MIRQHTVTSSYSDEAKHRTCPAIPSAKIVMPTRVTTYPPHANLPHGYGLTAAAASDKENDVTTVVRRKSPPPTQHHPSYLPHAFPPYGYPPPPTQHHNSYLPHAFPPPPPTQHHNSYLPHAFPPYGYPPHRFGYGYSDGYGIPTQYHPPYPPQSQHRRAPLAQKKTAATTVIEATGTKRSYGDREGCNNAKKKATTSKKKAVVPTKQNRATKKKAVPNKKKKKAKAIPLDQRRGRNFVAATTDCLSLGVSKKKAWKNLTAHCHKDPHLDCPILPSTMSNTLEEVLFIFCLHYPGDNDFDKMTDDGLLWLTDNGYYGEICLRFLSSTINNMIDQSNGIEGDCRDNIAFTDINMCPAPNNCGGDHNNPALQALTENVLIETIRLCPNANICFLGKKPNQYAKEKFLARLQKEGLANQFPEAFRMGSNSFFSRFGYLPHSQLFLMGCNTADNTRDLFRVVAFVIHAKFGTHINTDDENIQRMILPFATQAMTDARREAMMSVVIPYWDKPGKRKAHGESILAHWNDPNHVYNSTAYRAKLSKTSMGRRYKKTPGVDDMKQCRFCAQDYQFRQMQRHENQCPKNPNKV